MVQMAMLGGAASITTTTIDSSTYALVASYDDSGVQIIDITDPTDPTAVSAVDGGEEWHHQIIAIQYAVMSIHHRRSKPWIFLCLICR